MTSFVALWDFSLALYRHPEVEQMCLQLQDEWGANVNLLLWLRWLEVNNIAVAEHQLDAARRRIHTWDHEVVYPLRSLRRQLKTQFASRNDAIEQTRERIKNAELSAERVEQEWLEQLAADWQSSGQPIKPGDNITPYLLELQLPQLIRSESIAILSNAGDRQEP